MWCEFIGIWKSETFLGFGHVAQNPYLCGRLSKGSCENGMVSYISMPSAPSGLSGPTAPIGLIRLIGPIVLTVLTVLRDLRVLTAPTKKTKRKVTKRKNKKSLVLSLILRTGLDRTSKIFVL